MSAQISATLKQLQSRLAALTVDYAGVREEQRAVSKKQIQIQASMQSIEKQIKELSAADPVISEHALLRYLERAKGVDMDQLRTEVLTPELVAMIKTIKSGKVPMPGGLRAIVKNSVVVTIEAADT